MNGVISKGFRCAVYTRKSTEHNLDLAFTSLDAQREACEAYVRSQQHEGWRLLPERFDDGGLSGASLARPALQALLTNVRERKVDMVLNGHAHAYERSYPLTAGQVVGDGQGPVYIVEGGGGADPYMVAAQAFTAKAVQTYGT